MLYIQLRCVCVNMYQQRIHEAKHCTKLRVQTRQRDAEGYLFSFHEFVTRMYVHIMMQIFHPCADTSIRLTRPTSFVVRAKRTQACCEQAGCQKLEGIC